MATKRALPKQTLQIYSELFHVSALRGPSLSQQRVVKILEGTIRAYLTHGIQNTTYDRIAKISGISRQLIQHHFKNKEALFEMVAQYTRLIFQQMAVEAIGREKSPRKQLANYVGSLFTWVDKYPRHAKVWSLVYYYACINPRIRAINTELARVGHERGIALLKAGAACGEFADGDFSKRAKMIQTLYTGGAIVLLVEDLEVDKDTFRDQLIESCLNIALHNPPSPLK